MALAIAAAFMASNSRPVICFCSFCSSGFLSISSEPCFNNPCGLVAIL